MSYYGNITAAAMAIFQELWNDRNTLFSDIKQSCKMADERRVKEYRAVITIQSWFRGCRVRAYLHYLHECATVIQAHYKGHYYRNKYKEMLKEHYDQLKQNFYNKMATMIQSLWRGYYTRKYIHNYYAQKQYLHGLMLKNDAVRKQLADHSESFLTEQMKRKEERNKLRRSQDARKYHYMLSTESSPGVFTSNSFENDMKAVKYHKDQPIKKKKQSNTITTTTNDLTSSLNASTICSVDLSASTGDCRVRHHPLPPIKEKGPFKSPDKVYNQRRRLLKPTLRVSTPIDSVEQARKQLRLQEEQSIVVEDRFIPFTKVHHKYTPMLGSMTPYTKHNYGLRDLSNPAQKFNSVVRPIPIFEELNKTY